MFFGSFLHSLDEKGRLVIPRKMREEIGQLVFIMKGFDGALAIYSKEAFNKLNNEFNSLPFNKKENRAYLRAQLASVYDMEVDKMGRVQIPSALLTKYGIGKEVVVLGSGDHIEVWDNPKYQDYLSKAEEEFEDIAENLFKEEK